MQGYNLIDEKYALSTVFYAYLIREQFLIKRYSRKGTLLTYSISRSGGIIREWKEEAKW